MTVAFDAKTATVKNVSGVATLTISNLTVGSGSNRAMLLLVHWLSGSFPTGITATWDSGGTNQAMTLVTGTNSNNGTSSCSTAIYGLIAPTSGNKNLVLSWTGNLEAHATAISFTGVDQTSVAVAFPHGTATNQTTSTASPCSTTITSATDNMVVAGFSEQVSAYGAVSGTTLAKDDTTGPALAVVYSYNNGAATVTQTAAFTGSSAWTAHGCDILAAAASGVTGTLAVTETPDITAFNGDVLVSGTLAVTESTDTAAFNGSVVISGTLAVTETTDTAAFNGFVGVSGSLIATDIQDTAVFNGGVLVSGTLAVTEGADTASFNGDVIVSGTLVVTESTDTAAFNGTVGNVISGTLAVTETPDIAAFAGSVLVSGTLSTTETPDIAAFNGGVLVSGTFAVTEGLDTAVFSGIVASTISGTFAVTEAPDIAFFTDALAGGGRWHWLDGYKARKHTSPAADVKAAAAVLSKMGGVARAKSLTATQRSNIASTAAKARWK